jgi:hypothetical protein
MRAEQRAEWEATIRRGSDWIHGWYVEVKHWQRLPWQDDDAEPMPCEQTAWCFTRRGAVRWARRNMANRQQRAAPAEDITGEVMNP